MCLYNYGLVILSISRSLVEWRVELNTKSATYFASMRLLRSWALPKVFWGGVSLNIYFFTTGTGRHIFSF